MIDLGSQAPSLLTPENYHAVANVEDRPFVPADYVPLFERAAVTRSAGSAIGPSGEIERCPVQIPGSPDPDERREAPLVPIAI